jgi:hypothetical protein
MTYTRQSVAPARRWQLAAGIPQWPEAPGTHRTEADNRHPAAEEEADTHPVGAEESGSYQGVVAVDRSLRLPVMC